MAHRLSLPSTLSWQPQTFPQIAKSTLTQGLVDAAIPFGGGVFSVPPGTGTTGVPWTVVGTQPTTAYGAGGRGFLYNGTSNYHKRTTQPFALTSIDELTVLVWCMPNETGVDHVMFGCGNSGSNNALIWVKTGGTSGNFDFAVRNGAGTNLTYLGGAGALGVSTTWWGANKQALVICRQSKSKNFMDGYINGNFIASVNGSGGGAATFDLASWGAGLRTTVFGYHGGKVYLSAIWNRAIDKSEVLALSANPWQIFEFPARPLFINSSAGGAVNTNVTLSPASFSYSPASITPKTNRLVTLTGPSFTYSPNSLTQVTTRKASLSAVSYSWSIQSLAAQTTRNATLSPAAFTYAPNDLTTQLTRKATLSPVSWSWTINDLTAVFVGKVTYTVTLSPASFSFTPSALSASVAVPDAARSKGGWDPYYYKRRNKRRSKPEEVQEFVSEVLNAPAPEEAEAAKIAALQYLAIRNTALEAEKREALSHALREINDFYRHVRDEIKRRQILEEEEDEIDLLLLS